MFVCKSNQLLHCSSKNRCGVILLLFTVSKYLQIFQLRLDAKLKSIYRLFQKKNYAIRNNMRQVQQVVNDKGNYKIEIIIRKWFLQWFASPSLPFTIIIVNIRLHYKGSNML